jgi:hypothetical protein
MSTRGQDPTVPEAELDQFHHIDGLVDALRGISDARDSRTLIFAKGENTRHLRHDQVLRRWPVLGEPWAHAVEQRRVSSVDRTPGAASFGR